MVPSKKTAGKVVAPGCASKTVPLGCEEPKNHKRPLERKCHGRPSAGLLWERQFEEVPLELGWEIVPNCEYLFIENKDILIDKRG